MVVKPNSARHSIMTNATTWPSLNGRPVWNAAVVTAAPSRPGTW